MLFVLSVPSNELWGALKLRAAARSPSKANKAMEAHKHEKKNDTTPNHIKSLSLPFSSLLTFLQRDLSESRSLLFFVVTVGGIDERSNNGRTTPTFLSLHGYGKDWCPRLP